MEVVMKESLSMVIVQAHQLPLSMDVVIKESLSIDDVYYFQIAQCIDLVNRCHYDVVLLADHSITH